MATLAIRGHKERGKEVIEILEMLGGKNNEGYSGSDVEEYYIIEDGEVAQAYDWNDYMTFNLEEFLEKFPYKIGDKVIYTVGIGFIQKATWDEIDNDVTYIVNVGDEKWLTDAKHLQPYKEETMEEKQYKELRMPLDDNDKLATEATINGNKMLPPNGYLIGKITQVDNGMLVEYVKKQPQYPKTYVECCDVLGCDRNFILGTMPIKYGVLIKFQKLLICRDAYWKIAGDWKPDWNDVGDKYTIYPVSGEIWLDRGQTINTVLAFPTIEMRDAFYENFKDLIEECKELL